MSFFYSIVDFISTNWAYSIRALYAALFLWLLKRLVRVLSVNIYGKDESPKIVAAYVQMKGVSEKEKVQCAKVPWTKGEFVLKMTPNPVTIDSVINFKDAALASMGVSYDGIEVIPHEEITGCYRIFLSKLEKKRDDRGRIVSNLSVEDFPEFPKQKVKYFGPFPIGIVENKMARYCYYLGYNGRFLIQNDSEWPHLLINGPTNRGKSSLLLFLLEQKYLVWPHFCLLANPIGGAMDFMGAEYDPADLEGKPEGMARGQWVKQFKKMTNFFFIGDEDVFCNAVAELSKIIEFRKRLLEEFGAKDIYALIDVPAYKKDPFFKGRPQQVITLVLEDLTGLQTFADGKKRLTDAIKVALDFTTYSRKAGVHIWALSQIGIKEKLPTREMFRKIAIGMPSSEVSWYLNHPVPCPNVLGSFLTNGPGNLIEVGSFPEGKDSRLAVAIQKDLARTDEVTIAEDELFISRCLKKGNTFEEYEKVLAGQIKVLGKRRVDDSMYFPNKDISNQPLSFQQR